MLFESYVKENKAKFLSKVRTISSELGIQPNWLMAVMFNESRLDPKAHNDVGAVGLIQFLPSTANKLKTSTADLAKMSNIQQLDYVRAYYKGILDKSKKKIKSYFELHLLTFFPAAIGQKDNYVFATTNLPASKVAEKNSQMDINGDGKITMSDYKEYVRRRIFGTPATKTKKAKDGWLKTYSQYKTELLQLMSNPVVNTSNLFWFAVAGVAVWAYSKNKR